MSLTRFITERIRVYTLAAGLPRIKSHSASRATRIFCVVPIIHIFVSAITIRVRVTFSIVYFVLPCDPLNRPIQRDKLSPCKLARTSLISKPSMYTSSIRSRATASLTSNPAITAFTKSSAFCNITFPATAPFAPSPSAVAVSLDVRKLTHRVFRFMRIYNLHCSTIGV